MKTLRIISATLESPKAEGTGYTVKIIGKLTIFNMDLKVQEINVGVDFEGYDIDPHKALKLAVDQMIDVPLPDVIDINHLELEDKKAILEHLDLNKWAKAHDSFIFKRSQ